MKIYVACKNPGEPSFEDVIENDLPASKAVVKGYIETYGLDFAPQGRQLTIVCNEEARLEGMPCNVLDERLGDILGPVFITAVDSEGDFVSLTALEMGAARCWFDDHAMDPNATPTKEFVRLIRPTP